MKRFALLAVMVVVAGCATPPVANRAALLLDTDKAFSELAAKDGVRAAFLAYAADDAILMPTGQRRAAGKEEIGEHLEQFPPGTLTWEPKGADIAKSGELGYTWGDYIFDMRDVDGKMDRHYGKYVTVWRWRGLGWKFVMDIGNPSPPPGEEEEEANEK